MWRPVYGGIEATAFHKLSEDSWDELETEAANLSLLLADRDPSVYSRYGNWWRDMPYAQRRVLGG